MYFHSISHALLPNCNVNLYFFLQHMVVNNPCTETCCPKCGFTRKLKIPPPIKKLCKGVGAFPMTQCVSVQTTPTTRDVSVPLIQYFCWFGQVPFAVTRAVFGWSVPAVPEHCSRTCSYTCAFRWWQNTALAIRTAKNMFENMHFPLPDFRWFRSACSRTCSWPFGWQEQCSSMFQHHPNGKC